MSDFEFRNLSRREAIVYAVCRHGWFYGRARWATLSSLATLAALGVGGTVAAATDIAMSTSLAVALAGTWLVVAVTGLVVRLRARRPHPRPGPGGGDPAGDRSPRRPTPPGGSSAVAVYPEANSDEAAALGPTG